MGNQDLQSVAAAPQCLVSPIGRQMLIGRGGTVEEKKRSKGERARLANLSPAMLFAVLVVSWHGRSGRSFLRHTMITNGRFFDLIESWCGC